MEPFKYVAQPFSNVCGQSVVAMVTGVPVLDLIGEMGQRKTFPSDLKSVLESRGWTMRFDGIRLPDVPETPAALFVQMIVGNKLLGHWVLWTGSKYLDPAVPDREVFGSNCSGRFYSLSKMTAS